MGTRQHCIPSITWYNIPRKYGDMMIESILKEAIRLRISDIHITTNSNIALRVRKSIQKSDIFTSKADVIELSKKLCGDEYETFMKDRQIDLGGEIEGVRYRANIYFERGEIAIALRVIEGKIKSIVELNLPYVLLDLIKRKSGLILVTGPTGSGKSTTLAAMINEINKSTASHIITIEDPIEYIFTNEKSIVHQREIGKDLNSFDDGLRSILRQDPDVIMIGELRDRKTIETVLKASETGHLVLTTLHTSSVKQTINRITGFFGTEDATKIRSQLSHSLVAILCQKLIPGTDGRSMIPAFEIMINTTATANLIRIGDSAQLSTYMLTDQKKGSIPMDKSIENLIAKKLIKREDIE